MHLYDFLPGAITSAAKIFIGYPFETLKTRVQVNKTSYLHELHYYKTRPFRLYKGCALPLVSSTFKRSLQLTIFEEINKTHSPLVGGICGGAISAIITNPITIVRNNVQGLHKYNNTIDCIKQMYKKEGIKAFNKGFTINIIRDTLFCGSFLGSYGYLRNILPNEPIYHGLGGIGASFVTWITLIPFDTYRTMIQVGDKTMNDVNQMIRKDPRILWNGLPMMLLRSGPVNIFGMILYEKIRS